MSPVPANYAIALKNLFQVFMVSAGNPIDDDQLHSCSVAIMLAYDFLISELEDAVRTGSQSKRVATLRRVTDLFLGTADQLNDEQIGVFDNVLVHLIEKIETRALGELSQRLAPVDAAPIEAIRRLAHHDEITVAGPVLACSTRLATSDLVEIARTKSQSHLLAISGRARIEEEVTDVLADRGNQEVVHRLANNSGASFSQNGFATMSKRAEDDVGLAEWLMRRIDVPLDMLRALLSRATEAVRERLLAAAQPERQAEIRRVLAKVSDEVGQQVGRSQAEAQETVGMMHRHGTLNEGTLVQFAVSEQYDLVVAALPLLCSVPFELIDRLIHGGRIDALLVPCKAAGLDWATVRVILKMKCAGRSVSDHELEQAELEYAKLSTATAQRVLRFWQVRERASSRPN